MKKVAYILGYAGSVLALVFSMVMILTVPMALWDDVLADVADGAVESEHVIAINNTAIEMQEESWTDYSEDGLRDVAEQAADKYHGDPDAYDEAAQYIYKVGLNAMISMIVVAAAIVIAIVSLIGALVVKKAPTAGGVLLLITAFFLLLAAIYTNTLVPTFIASVVLALGGIAVFIPTASRAKRKASAPAYGARPYAPPQGGYAPPYAPPQGGYTPPYTPPQGGYAPPQGRPAPQYAPPQTAPPQIEPEYTAPENEGDVAPSKATQGGETADTGNPLPFPEETEKPGGEA